MAALPTRIFMTSYENSLSAAQIFLGIRTSKVIFDFTVAFLILHEAFSPIQYSLLFEIPRGNFQPKIVWLMWLGP